MKQFYYLFFLATFTQGMQYPPTYPLNPQSFPSVFYYLIARFETIKNACVHQTTESSTAIDAIAQELQQHPHRNLVSLLWHQHYLSHLLTICENNNYRNIKDLKLLNNNRLKELLGSNQKDLDKTKKRINVITTLNHVVWGKIANIAFSNFPHQSSEMSKIFLDLQKKSNSLFDKIFAEQEESLAIIDFLNSFITKSPYALFATLVWDPRTLKCAESRHQQHEPNDTKYALTLTLKQKVNELHNKITSLRACP